MSHIDYQRDISSDKRGRDETHIDVISCSQLHYLLVNVLLVFVLHLTIVIYLISTSFPHKLFTGMPQYVKENFKIHCCVNRNTVMFQPFNDVIQNFKIDI